ncbi:MAG: hypothetical protein IH989_02630 [Planctomycetes bacterium]|nr:hypothetical protein [Planctomycetota bacterium]
MTDVPLGLRLYWPGSSAYYLGGRDYLAQRVFDSTDEDVFLGVVVVADQDLNLIDRTTRRRSIKELLKTYARFSSEDYSEWLSTSEKDQKN